MNTRTGDHENWLEQRPDLAVNRTRKHIYSVGNNMHVFRLPTKAAFSPGRNLLQAELHYSLQ